jgi:hypothetical protein
MSNVKISNFMTEALQQNIEKPRSELPIEKQANFEGSWTNLMCERLRNPEIRKQVIDLLNEIEQSEKDAPIVKDLLSGKERIAGKKDQMLITRRYIPRTREQIESDFDKELQAVEQFTPITFDESCPSGVQFAVVGGREIISFNNTLLTDGEKPTQKVLNIAESHEKGHVLRPYNFFRSREEGFLERVREGTVDAKFAEAFDFSNIDCHDIYKKLQETLARVGVENSISEKEVQRRITDYLRVPMEIAERMSQLKNYFGMKSNEKFTKEHLDYAHIHYLRDTGLDNEMTQFFQAITPEKEDAFIELINSAGI